MFVFIIFVTHTTKSRGNHTLFNVAHATFWWLCIVRDGVERGNFECGVENNNILAVIFNRVICFINKTLVVFEIVFTFFSVWKFA